MHKIEFPQFLHLGHFSNEATTTKVYFAFSLKDLFLVFWVFKMVPPRERIKVYTKRVWQLCFSFFPRLLNAVFPDKQVTKEARKLCKRATHEGEREREKLVIPTTKKFSFLRVVEKKKELIQHIFELVSGV